MAILIEGLTSDELFALAPAEFDQLLFAGRPLVFRVGSAELLAEFRRGNDRLSLDLAEINGGGEGILIAIAAMAHRYARSRELQYVEWLVRATICAKPNTRLRALLERRGYEVKDVPERGECYYKLEPVRADR